MDEKKKKKSNGFFKKFMKGVGLFLLVIVVVVAIGVFGTYITGGFDPEKIYIQQLSINGVKEYVTITENDTSYTTKIDFAPADANQLTLTAKIITGGSLIEPLGSVVAGEPLELKFVKDDQGVTKGGEVEIKFVDSAQKAFTTLKVLIDVALDSNHIEITSNGNEMDDEGSNVLSTNVLTTVLEENAHTIKISASYDEMLNSYKGNWSPSANNSAVTLDKLKKMILVYNEGDVSVNSFNVNEVMGEENYYLIKYLTPATIEDFELDVYLYRTYFLESVFDESFANLLINALKTENYDRTSFNYETLNNFINNYVYHNSSVDVKNIYDTFSENGVVVMDPTKYNKNSDKFVLAIQNTLDYALVHKKILINVDKIEIKNIVNLNNNSELKFPVLQSLEYSIEDVYNNLGVSLVGVDDNTDKQVLFNTLRDIDIKLCYLTDETKYNDEVEFESSTLEEKINVINSHYKIGEKYLKIAGNDKFSISKRMNEDGSATWTLESLSPTSSSDKYYILFAYEKNDFETTQTIVNPSTRFEETFTYSDIDGVLAWRSSSGNTSELVYDLDTITSLNNCKYACTPITVTYTHGSVQYNTSKSGGVNVVNNLGSSTIVLNENNTIYINDENGDSIRLTHGADGGVYYKGREMSVGIRSSESATMTDLVIVRPDDLSLSMEYTHVKWFVKYFDNVIGGSANGFANNNKYYFKPVVETNYDDSGESKSNEIPTPYKLKNISDNAYITDASGNDEYFMEVGNNNFTLEALNAMPSESPIALYAVIIQTNMDDEPVIANTDKTSEGSTVYFKTLNYISQTSDHTLYSTQLVESLDFYLNDSGTWKNSTTQENDKAVYNFLNVIQNSYTGYLYLTNFTLDKNGGTSETTTNWLDENNNIVMVDAIDLEANKIIALERYYNDFITSDHWKYSKYDMSIEYGAVNPTTISFDYNNANHTDKKTIRISIENKNSSMEEDTYPYTLSVWTEKDNTLRSKIYTRVSATAYFNLVKAPES